MKGLQSQNTDMSKHYILTKPTRLSDLRIDDLEIEAPALHDKAARLQTRRWRKIKHQLA